MRYMRVRRPWWPYLSWAVMVFLCLVVGLGYQEQMRTATTQVVGGRVVVIDPGHGQPDPGSIGVSGALEKDIVLAIAVYVRELLECRGVVVHMTRSGDYDLAKPATEGLAARKREDLAARVALVNELAPDMLISIHANAFPSARWSGAQTFYPKGCALSHSLAVSIQTQLSRITGRTQRQASSQQDLVILRDVQVPATVVEVGFLSNPQEEALLKQDEYQQRVAWAIYAGIVQYVNDLSLPVHHKEDTS